MKTITFSAIKGGVGKSSLSIILANILHKSKMKVLVIDADPQNSTTFYYMPDSADYKKNNNIVGNLANILQGASIEDNIVNINGMENLYLIPSALELLMCKDISPDTLKLKLQDIKNYDYCIIDTAPTFDTLTLAALEAADIIVTPVQFSGFDYKSAAFYQDLLKDLTLEDKWKIVINRFKSLKVGGSLAAEYLSLFSNSFSNRLLDVRIPESSIIKKYIDTGLKITKAKKKMTIFEAVTVFARQLTGEDIYPLLF